ncbi:MAG: hypothetical protein HKN76_00675 [Saprospiraceae bacterium]|nr:hypothetical protein [Saprospiraceae bacterium]
MFFFICCNSSDTSKQGKEELSGERSETDIVQWLDYSGTDQASKNIVLISGDEEYRSEEAMPQLAKILSTHHGFDCTVLFAQDPAEPGLINPNYLHHIPGLDALDDADLMIIFTRFRELPHEQMQHIDNYLKSGKPVLGIRTATHAFNIKDSTSTWVHYSNYYSGEDRPVWKDGFGRLVLGERWFSHHGHHKHQSTRGLIAPASSDFPITNGINDGDIWGSTDVYGVRLPLPGDSQPIILGQVINRRGDFDENDIFYGMRDTDDAVADVNPASKNEYDPNDPMMPIAWTKSYQLPEGQPGKSFTSTIGSSSDLLNPGVRRLLVNAAFWLLGEDVPEEANVNLVGKYQPSAYGFKTEEGYWNNKNLRVADYMLK